MKTISFHRAVQRDVNDGIRHYREISEELADDFWIEVSNGFGEIRIHPKHHHFDSSGYRRLNLEQFPYNILYEELPDRIRVVVVRHNSRRASFGTRREQ